jgi:hypothetical protein
LKPGDVTISNFTGITKFDLAKVSKPGDALRAILLRKQAEVVAKRATVPSTAVDPASPQEIRSSTCSACFLPKPISAFQAKHGSEGHLRVCMSCVAKKRKNTMERKLHEKFTSGYKKCSRCSVTHSVDTFEGDFKTCASCRSNRNKARDTKNPNATNIASPLDTYNDQPSGNPDYDPFSEPAELGALERVKQQIEAALY